jgi:hypothetical protein
MARHPEGVMLVPRPGGCQARPPEQGAAVALEMRVSVRRVYE